MQPLLSLQTVLNGEVFLTVIWDYNDSNSCNACNKTAVLLLTVNDTSDFSDKWVHYVEM